MIRRMIIILALLVAVFLAAAPVSAQETGTGIITGQITNGTTGEPPSATMEVSISIYEGGTAVDGYSINTDDRGNFTFTALATGPDYGYNVGISYLGIDYVSEPLQFPEGETAITTGIKIYETTESDAGITVGMSHTILYAGEGLLTVKEFHLIANGADKTYIGTLQFPLPPDAIAPDTTGDLSWRAVDGGNVLVDMSPVLPGMHEVSYSYQIDASSGKFSLSHPASYPTTRYDLLIADPQLEVTSRRLSETEPMTIKGTLYSHLSGEEIAAGEMLDIQISNPSAGGINWAGWLAISGGVIFAAAVVLYLRLRKPGLQPAGLNAAPDERQQLLLLELAGLDDAFEAGNIDEATYQASRQVKKAELMDLLQQSEGDQGGS